MTETIDKLFLELSQFTKATTAKEIQLQQQLAAAQAENLRLRMVLERLACLGNGDEYGNSIGNRIAQDALATPPGDMAALREVIACVLEEILSSPKPESDWIRSGEWTPDCLK